MKPLLTIIALLSLSFCAFALPTWYNNSDAVGYTVEEYFIGVGSGTTQEQANSVAKEEIATQISVQVQSSLESTVSSIESSSQSYYSENLKKATKLMSDVTLKGVQIVKQEKEKNNFYALAVISKDKLAQGLYGEIDPLWQSINRVMDLAKKNASEGNLLSSIQNYLTAADALSLFYSKKALYDNISDNPYPVNEALSIPVIDAKIRSIVSNIKITVKSGDGQKAKAGTSLAEPICFRLSYSDEDGNNVPLNGFPVNITYGNGKVIGTGISNKEGIYSVYITAVASDDNKGKVIATAGMNKLPLAYRNVITTVQTVAEFETVPASPLTFRVEVKDKDGKRLNQVESRIIKLLAQMNHTCSENAPLALIGSFSVKDKKEVEGFNGTQTLVNAELVLNLKADFANESYGSVSSLAKGMSNKGESDAEKAAYNNVTIDQTQFASMISGAESKLQKSILTYSTKALAEGKKLYYQKKLQEAIAELAKVTANDQNVNEAMQLMQKIRDEITSAENERQARLVKEQDTKLTEIISTPAVTQTVPGDQNKNQNSSANIVIPQEDEHYIQADDYFVSSEDWEDGGYINLDLAKLITPASANTKKEAEFLMVYSGEKKWLKNYWQTRVANKDELKLGTVVICFNYCEDDIYIAPKEKQDARSTNWFMAKITDTSDMYKGYVTVSGGYLVKLNNIRVIR